MVERFLLPEDCACAAENQVGSTGANAFYALCDPVDFDLWRNQQMNVIGHYYEGVEVETVKD